MGVHAVTVVLLLAAFACHGLHFNGGGLMFFFLAAALELWFWILAVQAPRHAPLRQAPLHLHLGTRMTRHR